MVDHYPAELVEMSLDWLTLRGPTGLGLTKRQLSSCSLTCKHWARRCRPLLFSSITLATRDDALTLLEFIRQPSCYVGAWIETLHLLQREPSCPWTHLLYMRAAQDLPNLQRVTHTLEGTGTDSTRAALNIRSLHPSVPHYFPCLSSVASRQPSHIELKNLLFRSASNLVDFAGTLGSYTTLRCDNVLFQQGDAEPIELRLKSARRSLMKDIHLSRCSDIWVYAWICITTDPPIQRDGIYSGPSKAFIEKAELHRLGSFLNAMRPIRKCEDMQLTRREPSHRGFVISAVCEEPEKCSPDLSVEVDRFGKICGITVSFSGNNGSDCVPLRYDWEEVGQIIAPCTALRKFLVNVDAASSDHFETLLGKLSPLKPLSKSLEIRFWSRKFGFTSCDPAVQPWYIVHGCDLESTITSVKRLSAPRIQVAERKTQSSSMILFISELLRCAIRMDGGDRPSFTSVAPCWPSDDFIHQKDRQMTSLCLFSDHAPYKQPDGYRPSATYRIAPLFIQRKRIHARPCMPRNRKRENSFNHKRRTRSPIYHWAAPYTYFRPL